MTRKEVAELARSEERWRFEVLWRMESLTWSARQSLLLLQRVVQNTGGVKTELTHK